MRVFVHFLQVKLTIAQIFFEVALKFLFSILILRNIEKQKYVHN